MKNSFCEMISLPNFRSLKYFITHHFASHINLCLLILLLAGCATIDDKKAAINDQESQLLQLLQTDPGNPQLISELGEFYFERYNQGKSVNDLRKAIDYFEKLTAAVPDHLGMQIRLYDAYYRLAVSGDEDAGLKTKKLFLLLPEQIRGSVNPPSLALYFSDLIKAYKFGTVDHVALRQRLLDAAAEQPKNSATYRIIAKGYQDDEHQDLAIATLLQALKHEPEDGNSMKALGQLYLKRAFGGGCPYEPSSKGINSDLKKAAKHLSSAIKYLPDDIELRSTLSSLYEMMNLTPLSVNQAQAALRIEATADTRMNLADVLTTAEHYEEARDMYLQLIAEGIDNAYLQIAYLYFYQGDWQNAVNAIDQYIGRTAEQNFYALLMKSVAEYEILGVSFSREKFRHETIGIEATDWESNLGSYWLKDMDEDELISNAKNVCQRSEADFYIGYNYFKEGNLLEAKSHFEQILNNHVYDYVEYKMARFLLTKISIQETTSVNFRF